MSLNAGDLAGTAHMQVNSETDFATKTEQFRSMVKSVAAAALSSEGTH
jgi:translation elongation factor EF-Ts